MKDSIYFWFDNPPKAGKGAFNYVANHWPNKVYFVFNNDFRTERKAAGWNDGDYGNANIISLFNDVDPDNTIAEIFLQDPNAIHFVNGLTTNIMHRICKYFTRVNRKIFVMTERPVLVGSIYEKIMRNIFFHLKYRYLNYKYSRYIAALLPLGKIGVKTFRKYGWRKDKMYIFMYNPLLPVLESNPNIRIKKGLKFLYIGRFYYKTKGVDVLMKATRYLKGNWSLDMVGGYGTNAEEVIEWASKSRNVNYQGIWNSNSVIQNMRNYDVVCVPTRYDGWNLLINESIHAGIGIISTDEAVSHEVIEKSQSGLIVKAGDSFAFAKAMQYAIDNPQIVEQWKYNAAENIHLISSDAVGHYLYDIINYEIYKEGNKPICPWI